MQFDMSGYVDVAERIRIFREKYPNGSLQPADLSKHYDVINVGEKMFVVYVAAAYRDPNDARPGIGVAWEPFPGTTPYTRDSELMNVETSAWGRAIIATLAADTQKIASAQEVRNRQDTGDNIVPMAAKQPPQRKPTAQKSSHPATNEKATFSSVGISEAQIKLLSKLAREKNYDAINFASNSAGRKLDELTELTKKEASTVITELMNAEAVQ